MPIPCRGTARKSCVRDRSSSGRHVSVLERRFLVAFSPAVAAHDSISNSDLLRTHTLLDSTIVSVYIFY